MSEDIRLIGAQYVAKKPLDISKSICINDVRLYIGDSLVYASSENEYFLFGLRIKAIK